MQPMPVALRAEKAVTKQNRPTKSRRPARGLAALRNPPSSLFFKEGIIQESRILLFSIWALLFVPTASSPLWKRGDRGDFGWFALDPIIFPQLPFVKGGKRFVYGVLDSMGLTTCPSLRETVGCFTIVSLPCSPAWMSIEVPRSRPIVTFSKCSLFPGPTITTRVPCASKITASAGSRQC